MADTFTPFNRQKKAVNLFTEGNPKTISSPDNSQTFVGVSRMPASSSNENMSRMPNLFTANDKVKNVLKRNSPIYKEEWKPEISAAVPEMAAGKPKETVKPIFQGKKPEAANNAMPQAAAPEAKKEMGFWDSLFTPKKEGEYSTAREIGTGIANFAEHFGNSLSGTGNAGVTDAWDGIRQEYREKAPNSDISKLYQNTYKKFGIDTAGKSAWDLKRMHPDIKYLQDQKQMEDAQKLALAQAAARGSGGGSGAPKIKDPTEGERKNLGYYERMKNADSIIDNTKGYVGNEFLRAPEFLGNRAKSSERQLVENAKRDWMIANLRKESGAAIGAEEYDSQDKTYFPQPGDSPETLENKRKQREQVRRNTFLEAGNAAAMKHLGGQ